MSQLASLPDVSAATAPLVHAGSRPPPGAAVQPGALGLPDRAEATAQAPGPKWYRLPEESWAMIRAEYLAGATAKQLALKWGVSPTSVYRHACAEGFTKARRGEAINLEAVTRFAARAAEAEGRALAEAKAAAERRREEALEADPLTAAKTLLRRAAGAALHGRGAAAQDGMKLACELLRGAKLLAEVRGGGFGAGRPAEEEEAPDPPGWRDSEESRALDASILTGLSRIRVRRGRAPPQRLPLFFTLADHEHCRPLAEAMGLVVEGQDWVECEDFDAALAHARAEGRGAAIEDALTRPIPLERCTWLSEAEKAAVLAREAAGGRGAEDAPESVGPATWEEGSEDDAGPDAVPPSLGLDGTDDP